MKNQCGRLFGIDTNRYRKKIMLPTTIDIIRSALKSDPSVTPSERTRILAFVKGEKQPEKEVSSIPNQPNILSRAETARRLSKSLRTIDKLSADGHLPKHRLPGRKRGGGFLESHVNGLMGIQP